MKKLMILLAVMTFSFTSLSFPAPSDAGAPVECRAVDKKKKKARKKRDRACEKKCKQGVKKFTRKWCTHDAIAKKWTCWGHAECYYSR